METSVHSMNALFAQLGLAADDSAIDRFIATHAALPPGILLQDAPFWNPAQRALLRSELGVDADWTGVIDQLNVRLRR